MIDVKNQADALIYQTEKSLTEHGDKLDDATKTDIQTKIDALKGLLESGDTETIKKASDELTQASYKLAEAMYQQTAGQPEGEAAQGEQETKPDDDVVDADYEEVK